MSAVREARLVETLPSFNPFEGALYPRSVQVCQDSVVVRSCERGFVVCLGGGVEFSDDDR